MKREDLELFIDNLDMLIATGSPYVHKIAKSIASVKNTAFASDSGELSMDSIKEASAAYMIEDSCNSDITLVVPPSLKTVTGFNFWRTEPGKGRHGKVKVVGGSENLTGLCSLFEELQAESIDCSELIVDSVTDAEFMFYGAKIEHLDLEWLRDAKLKYIRAMFMGCKTDVIDLNCLTLSACKSYKELFRECSAEIVGELHCDTVTDTSSMFCLYSGNKVLDLTWIDMSNVTDSSNMFCSLDVDKLSIDLSKADRIEEAGSMFYKCKIKELTNKLVHIDGIVSGNRMFNETEIDGVKIVSKATRIERIYEMFKDTKAKYIDLSEFEVRTSGKLWSDNMFKCTSTKLMLCKQQVGGFPSGGLMKFQILLGNNENISIEVV